MQLAARMQKKLWAIAPVDERRYELAEKLKISPLLAQILINRGIDAVETATTFLKPKLTDLISPEKMPGAAKAVSRIKQAVQSKEKITIYGDYDVDGITGVSILWQLLKLLGADVEYYIPHRIDEGYGLNCEAVQTLIKAGTELLITVDCGITACQAAEMVKSLGVDMIITDHHQPGQNLPHAYAIVHPVSDSSYPNQTSSGAMVAFKLAWAVANEFNSGQKLTAELREFMLNATSLAAMGTIADVVDLRGENRVLTSWGLKGLAQSQLTGIMALIETASLTGCGLDSYHIGFRLAPILNAAGRMGHARLAVELLTSDSSVRSAQIAEYLKEQNALRRKCEQNILKQAHTMIMNQGMSHPDKKSIVLSSENWHSGVIGIVASRIVDKYYRPTIMLNCSNGIAQGSARSIAGFDLLAAIEACSEHLVSFGGHKMAAGLSIETDKIELFANKLEEFAKNNIKDEDIVAKLHIDAETSLGELNMRTVESLNMLEPCGEGNPKPVLATKGVRLASKPRKVGQRDDHLQITITDNTGTIRCVGFGMGKLDKKLQENEFFNVAYEPQINNYNGSSSVQLVLTDIQFE